MRHASSDDEVMLGDHESDDEFGAQLAQLSLAGKPPRSPSPTPSTLPSPTSSPDRRRALAQAHGHVQPGESSATKKAGRNVTRTPLCATAVTPVGRPVDSATVRLSGADGYKTPVKAQRTDEHGSWRAEGRDYDEWRVAVAAESGDRYVYNRRTRRASWELPANSVVMVHANGKRVWLAPRENAAATRGLESVVRRIARKPLSCTLPLSERHTLKSISRLVAKDTDAAIAAAAAAAATAAAAARTPAHRRRSAEDSNDKTLTRLKLRVRRRNGGLVKPLADANLQSSPEPIVYCVYCGMNICVSKLSAHLSTCKTCKYLQDSETDLELRRVLNQVWSGQVTIVTPPC